MALPGDLNRMGGSAAEWIAGQFGASPETAGNIGGAVRRMSVFGAMPTSEQVNADATAIMGDAGTHSPQTTAGEYARTAGQFVPSAAFGTGGLMQRGAQVLVPAITSETAGQLTDGTAAEPYARAAGAIAGGVAAGRVTRPKAAKLPTASDIKQSAGYSALKEPMKNARVTPEEYRRVVSDVWNEAQDFGLTDTARKEVGRTLRNYAVQAREGGTSLHDLELMRRSLANLGKNTTDNAARELSRRMVERLDDSIGRISEANIQASGATGRPVLEVVKEARAAWRTGIKAELVEQAQERARNAASGYENGLRVEFRKILNNKTLSRMFTETERQAMQQVVRGTAKGNALRFLGTFGVPMDQGRNWLGAAAGVAGGAQFGGPLGALLLPAVGTAARAGSNAITRNNATFAEALVKGGPEANKIVREAMLELQAARNSGLLRTGTQALAAARNPSGQSQPVAP